MQYQNIKPAELDERIELQKETYTDDSMGGVTNTWSTQATVWAQVRPLSGNERQRNDVLQAEGGYRVVMWNRSDLDINESWRIVWRSRNLNIRHIEDHGPGPMYLVIEATAGMAT